MRAFGDHRQRDAGFPAVQRAEASAGRDTAAKERFRLFASRRKHAVPPGQRVYAIGDVHGRNDLLRFVLGTIVAEAARSPLQTHLVLLGDYIDRGPDSRDVIDMLLHLPGTLRTHFLRGNHEQALLDFLDRPLTYPEWRDFGADATLLSYGVRPPPSIDTAALIATRNQLEQCMPAEHLRFFSTLVPSVSIGDYLFVHAGVRPGVPLDRQDAGDLMWIRDEFLSSSNDHGKLVVHGHTPIAEPVFRPNRIGIDTGAYATGRLTALVLEGRQQRVFCS
jgi:serine/threonine protein phosphatase 1